MLAHCLAGHRMFCVALMKPGENGSNSSEDHFFHVAGCGLVRACVGREDGTSNLILQGLRRVRFHRFRIAKRRFGSPRVEEIASQAGNPVETDALGRQSVWNYASDSKSAGCNCRVNWIRFCRT